MIWLQGFSEKFEIIILIPVFNAPCLHLANEIILGVSHFSCGWSVVATKLLANIL